MDRRAFVTGLGALIAAPIGVEAQPPSVKVPRVGYLSFRPAATHLDEAFRQGLRELGYIEGQNVSIEYRWADWDVARISVFADELVRLKMDVIVSVGGNVPALAVKKVVHAVPVVFTAGNPVTLGIVPRLDRPGGNLTGVNLATTELNVKRLEFLRAAVPGVARVAVLAQPGMPAAETTIREVEDAARALGVKLQILGARTPQEIDQAFLTMMRQRVGALLVLANPMFLGERERIVKLAFKARLPGIFEWREFAEAGGLLSYGANIVEMYKRLAVYVDKILKGSRPGDLPIEQPTKFELVINLKTAKALGLTIPPSLLLRADHVIE